METQNPIQLVDSPLEMKKIPDANPDRLSELPEFLLVQIISCLPMDEAIRTGLLCTTWKNLWKHVTQLTLHYPSQNWYPYMFIDALYDELAQSFVDAVHASLLQITCPNVEKFSLILEDPHFPICSLDKWFQWAYSCNVEVLTWECHSSSPCVYEWILHNSSLEKLCIHGNVDIKLLGRVVTWTSLKSLSLSLVDIGDDDIANVLLGCPALENLVLKNVDGIRKLNIGSPSVKSLRVVQGYDSTDVVMNLSEVTAPWLEYLELAGSFECVVLRLTNVPSLLKAHLNLTYGDGVVKDESGTELFLNQCTPLLENVSHVDELALGQAHIQVLSMMKLLGRFCPLFGCKHLTINVRAFRHELPGIAYLLQRSPHVETLIIKVQRCWPQLHGEGQVQDYIQGVWDKDGVTYLSEQKLDFPYLKNVKISRTFYRCSHEQLSDCHNEERYDLELVAFILRSSSFLEKLIITSPRHESDYICRHACPRKCVSKYFEQMCHDLNRCLSAWFEDGEWEVVAKESSCEIICTKCVFVGS